MGKAYSAMNPCGGWDDALNTNKEKRIFNHSVKTATKNGQLYCFREVKEGISG